FTQEIRRRKETVTSGAPAHPAAIPVRTSEVAGRQITRAWRVDERQQDVLDWGGLSILRSPKRLLGRRRRHSDERCEGGVGGNGANESHDGAEGGGSGRCIPADFAAATAFDSRFVQPGCRSGGQFGDLAAAPGYGSESNRARRAAVPRRNRPKFRF